MTDTERAQLAAVEHYDRRARRLYEQHLDPPYMPLNEARYIIARARRAELLDPDPLPHIRRSADA